MALARLAASCSGALGCRAVHTQLQASSLSPMLAATSLQAARAAGGAGAVLPPRRRSAARTFATLDSPHYDDSRKKVNVFNNYTVYKSKAAMSLKVIKPTWQQVTSGLALDREGTVLLEFAKGENRKYDWDRKENFALSAVECARVLEVTESRVGTGDHSFFHDPNKGQAGEGTVTKSLAIKPADKGGWFFTVNVKQGDAQNSVSCVVDENELRLIKTLLTFLIPRIMGFDEAFAGPPAVADSGNGGQAAGAPF